VCLKLLRNVKNRSLARQQKISTTQKHRFSISGSPQKSLQKEEPTEKNKLEKPFTHN